MKSRRSWRIIWITAFPNTSPDQWTFFSYFFPNRRRYQLQVGFHCDDPSTQEQRQQKQHWYDNDGSFIKTVSCFIKKSSKGFFFQVWLWQELSWNVHQEEALVKLDGFGWCRLMVHPITSHCWRSRFFFSLGCFPDTAVKNETYFSCMNEAFHQACQVQGCEATSL